VNLSHQNGVDHPGKETRAEIKAVGVREKQAHGRVEGDGEDGGDGHAEVLGECQGLEEPALLRLQRKNRHERDRDHE
jgi:hypothetical protein